MRGNLMDFDISEHFINKFIGFCMNQSFYHAGQHDNATVPSSPTFPPKR